MLAPRLLRLTKLLRGSDMTSIYESAVLLCNALQSIGIEAYIKSGCGINIYCKLHEVKKTMRVLNEHDEQTKCIAFYLTTCDKKGREERRDFVRKQGQAITIKKWG
jgi:hypothetical protein